MEESGELQSEENKVSMDKKLKRKLKTPAQVMALEKFYNEHKYPTEDLKVGIAEEIGLTEKQVSGWFCHRRLKDKRLLKDEAAANGRQDRSSGVIQDHGSGLGQDSCGSSKHGDYRHIDPKEVESHGLYNHDLSVGDMAYGRGRNHYAENASGMDDTSSESSSFLQERMFPQGQDPYETEPSRFLTPPIKSLPPLNPKGANNTGYKPSGYLKVKGEIEHAAITAVKKQLGRHYLEDGPLLGIEFDSLPPGAFECQTEDPVHKPYGVADPPALRNSPEISTVKRRPGPSSRYDAYYTKHSAQDSHMEGVEFGYLHDSDVQDKHDKKARHDTKHRQTLPHFSGRNSSLDLYEDSIGDAFAYNSTKNHRMGTKRGGVEGMRSDSASNHSDHYEENLGVKHSDFLPHGYDNINTMNVQRSEHVKSKPSNSIRNSRVSVDPEERGLSARMAKEEMFKGEKKAKKLYRNADAAGMLSNEMMVAKRVKANTQYNVKQSPVAETEQRKNQRSTAEMPLPSSFSEDETADTSSSLD